MNKSKKKIIAILVIMITFALLGFNIIKAYTSGKYTNTDRNVIIGFVYNDDEAKKQYNKSYTLTTGQEVKVVQMSDPVKGGQVSILNQANVWCAEKGTDIPETANPTYTVGEEKNITDDELAYIIANGPKMDGTLEDDWRGPHQLALWRYLSDSSSADKKEIIKGMDSIYDYKYTDAMLRDDGKIPSSKETEYVNKTNNILWAAKQYANRVKNFGATIEGTPAIDYSTENPTVVFKIKGTYDNFGLKINKSDGSSRTVTPNTSVEIKDASGAVIGHMVSIQLEKEDYVGGTVDIVVEAKMTKYTGSYRLLEGITDTQRLLVATAVGSETITKTSTPIGLTINTDVSLQKYITKVNGHVLTTDETPLTAREDKMTINNDTEVKGEIIPGTDATGKGYKYGEASEGENAVKIEAGDEVTYRIYVYNNATVKATNIVVKDILPFYIKSDGSKAAAVSTRAEDIKVKKDGSGNDVTWTHNTSFTEITWNTGELAAGAKTYYDVTLKFDKYIDGVIENTACINSSEPNNSANYRTVDRDYVQMKQYSVALEKYVSAINGNDLLSKDYDINGDSQVNEVDCNLISKSVAGFITLTTEQKNKADLNGDGKVTMVDALVLLKELREIHPKYKTGEEKYKEENKVPVEVDDTVTYTIKLINTGETTIKVTEIEDTFDDNNNANIVYEDNSISGYGKNFDVKKEDGKLKITLQDPEEIPAGEFRYLTLNFKVEVPKENSGNEQVLKNTAKVTQITNKTNISVRDGDGEENNEDSDWIETQVYAVSLEKYVSAVNGNDVTPTREGKAEYLTKDGATYVNKTDEDTTWTQHNQDKYYAPVTVRQGDIVTYTIQVRNDGETSVYVTEIKDLLPNGVKYNGTEYRATEEAEESETLTAKVIEGSNEVSFKNLEGKLLVPGEIASFTIEVEVLEDNNSLNTLQNTAEITQLKNKNGITEIKDSSPNDNKDNDYINLNYEEPPVEDKITYSVEKVWDDDNNKAGKRPSSIKVELHRIGAGKIGEVELKDSNNWKHTWDNLDRNDTEGNEYQYFAKEITTISNYSSEYTTTGNKTVIKNIYYEDTPPVPDTIDITVQKYWKNDVEANRPSDIKVQLYKNGNVEGSVVILKADDGWKYTWTGLDKSCSYEVVEVGAPADYTVSYDGFNIYNTYKSTTPDPNPRPDPDPVPDPIPDPLPDPPVFPATIGGFVWNDQAWDKELKNYNGIYDSEHEYMLDNIKVSLFRVELGIAKEIASTYTVNGYYGFADINLKDNLDLLEEERFIKGKKVTYIDPNTGQKVVTNAWESYYSYYVVFEYDGIKYTSAKPYNSFTTTEELDSNAREKSTRTETFEGKVDTDRKTFNDKLSTIDNAKGIIYRKINENGLSPQSLYENSLVIDNEMQASTSLINMATATESTLDHVNLGLRGRDIFDLELTSDVYSIEVNVNGQQGVYNYTNKATIRRSPVEEKYAEDMKNKYKENFNYAGEEQEQKLRKSDYNNLDSVYVTYKIAVKNTSHTLGTATKIINYYDDAYTYEGVTAGINCGSITKAEEKTGGSGYKALEITISDDYYLDQGREMIVYVRYKLNTGILTSDKVATYNMAEISQYKTKAKDDDNEATRGLLDKDSAPGSAKTEFVNLHPDTKGTVSTVDYYFGGNDLSVLKYEDDTYATPTLYFVKTDTRTITGIVFEDLTVTDEGTRIKTGDGVYKLEDGEVGVYGAIVELVELKEETEDSAKIANRTQIKATDGKCYPVVKSLSTELDGTFEFIDVIPGNYIIRYYYGDTKNTALLGQYNIDKGYEISGNLDELINKQSYNGEDYQATNNGQNDADEVGIVRDKDGKTFDTTRELNTTLNYWYVFNESNGISTAKDNGDRRYAVTDYVIKKDEHIDERMRVLNAMRDYIGTYTTDNGGTLTPSKVKDYKTKEIRDPYEEEQKITGIDDVINNTYMFADTQNFTVTVEKTVKITDENRNFVIEKLDSEGNGIGVGEWTIFPLEGTIYPEYTISEMNFGIAEVPVTTVDLQKYINGFKITDSTGSKVIASARIGEDGQWNVETGDVLYLENSHGAGIDRDTVDVSIEDEKLQGARLEVEYAITKQTYTEKNFDDKSIKVKANITGLVDFVDNKFSYNPELGNNAGYWEVITYENFKDNEIAKLKALYPNPDDITLNDDLENLKDTDYTTILKLKDDSRFFEITETEDVPEMVTLTLERVLSSTATLDELLSTVVDISSYENTIQITDFEYKDSTDPTATIEGIDRIRTTDRRIILPGVINDRESAEVLVIHPPTGDSSISIVYYLVAMVGLAVLAAGVFGIKKFVVKK